MIPVKPRAEPANFDEKVRAKGRVWLQKNGLPLAGRLPKHIRSRAYWRDCIDDLYAAYDGTCAYLAVFFERATGGASVDHMIPKSQNVEAIYEWSNYRLASRDVNARKKDHEGILDPFELPPGTFYLDLMSGSIYPNPSLPFDLVEPANATIQILGLDLPVCREMRARHFSAYLSGAVSADYLKTQSPFVFSEVERQGLLL